MTTRQWIEAIQDRVDELSKEGKKAVTYYEHSMITEAELSSYLDRIIAEQDLILSLLKIYEKELLE